MAQPQIDLIAHCTWDQALALVDWDHHRVLVDGRPAVILTYHWYPMEHDGSYDLAAVFAHALKHPQAPDEVQQLINQLKFQTIA